jgi:hypothetical protein
VLSLASPTLSASLSSAQLTLSWPLASAGFVLMTRTNLTSGGWVQIASPPPQIVGNQWQITLPVSGNTQFFRLEE